MKNNEYWEKRFEAVEALLNQNANTTVGYINKQFNAAQKTIDEQIEKWYGRFAKNNNITLADARSWLSSKDLSEFKWDVNEFIKYGKEAVIDPALIKQLENASVKFHISKLEALKMQTQMTVNKLYGQTDNTVLSAVKDTYLNGYYHSAFEIQQGFGIGWDISAINESQVQSVLKKPWTLDKKTFSDRLWTQKQDLVDTLQTQLTQNLILGRSPDEAIKLISTKFGQSKRVAGRLVMTESAYFASASQKQAFKDLDVEEYEIVATLDGRTSEICQSLDGKTFKTSEFDAGITAPPFHPWCRTTTAPYFADESAYAERAARDDNGKTYYVPQNMKYPKWKETFVDGGSKDGLKEIVTDNISHFVDDLATITIPASSVPKKEYLTKKKLQTNITNLDGQIKDLEYKYNGDVLNNGSSDDAVKYVDLTNKRKEYQELLNTKLVKEQTKALTKRQTILQEQLDNYEIKGYSGIWKDDVTTLDWKSKSSSIQAKRDYFQKKINSGTLTPDERDKFEQLLKDLDEFDEKGKEYFRVQNELKQIQNTLTSLKKNGIMGSSVDDPFTQARKDAALWAKSPKEADVELRDVSGDVWRNASKTEKEAIYEYTRSYSKFNEPLRGYEYGTNKFLGVGNVDLDQIGVNSYGKFKPGEVKKEINAMIDIIDKSSYPIDVWLQRGTYYGGMDEFLGISQSDFNLPEKNLQQLLVGKDVTDYGFMSTGDAKGYEFNNRPIIFNIYAPKGTKMMYAEPFSYYGGAVPSPKPSKPYWDGISKQTTFNSEAEVIIQRGTTFTITKVEKSNGTIFIDMDLISQR